VAIDVNSKVDALTFEELKVHIDYTTLEVLG